MVARLLRFAVDGWVDPADAFVAIHGDAPDAVWLDAGAGADSGRSFLGAGRRVATASIADGQVTVRAGGEQRVIAGTMLDVLRADLAGRERLESATSDLSFALGWVGWLGYESGAAQNGIPVAASDGPDAAMVFVDRAVVIDHGRRSIELIAADGDGGAEDWAAATRAALARAAGSAARYAAEHPLPAEPADAVWRHSDEQYLALIRACQESIRQGDAYQLCLTNQATARVERDALAVHLRLRASSPAHHGGFVRIDGQTLVSSSPEQFLAVTPDGLVRTKPIKGTRPRGTTVAHDLDLRAELEASDKERAENVMIVDLMRNDLGRVCEIGSVEVHHLLAVESYPQVHQLVSTVQGRLLPGLGAVDAIDACFPAGSMTGAPKLSAMRILHGLEGGPRGVYSGCFGYLGLDGSADLAMVIRSIAIRPGRVSIGAGGGITALSVPAEELEEVAVKARALLEAAGLADAAADPAGSGNGWRPSNV